MAISLEQLADVCTLIWGVDKDQTERSDALEERIKALEAEIKLKEDK